MPNIDTFLISKPQQDTRYPDGKKNLGMLFLRCGISTYQEATFLNDYVGRRRHDGARISVQDRFITPTRWPASRDR